MTAYLWAAHKSEPGHDGQTYTVTATAEPPAPIGRPAPVTPGLVDAGQLYDGWRFVGRVDGDAEVRGCHPGATLRSGWATDLWLSAAEIADHRAYRRQPRGA